MDRVHHEPEGGVDKGAGFFGVEAFDQLHRAFDVGEESGDGLALTLGGAAGFHGGLLRENAFSQMPRGPAPGVHGPGSGVGRRLLFCLWPSTFFLHYEWRAAFPAELKLRRVLPPPVRAAGGERGPPPPAQFLSRGALGIAPGTPPRTPLAPFPHGLGKGTSDPAGSPARGLTDRSVAT